MIQQSHCFYLTRKLETQHKKTYAWQVYSKWSNVESKQDDLNRLIDVESVTKVGGGGWDNSE